MLIKHAPGCLAQMMEAARSAGGKSNVIAIEEAPGGLVQNYGVLGVGERQGALFPITKMIEKPQPADAPSNLIITGRYILQPEIFDLLAMQTRGAGGEIQLTDAMIALAGSQKFWGYKFAGKSFDCGSKIGFLTANVAYALSRPEFGPQFRDYLKNRY